MENDLIFFLFIRSFSLPFLPLSLKDHHSSLQRNLSSPLTHPSSPHLGRRSPSEDQSALLSRDSYMGGSQSRAQREAALQPYTPQEQKYVKDLYGMLSSAGAQAAAPQGKSAHSQISLETFVVGDSRFRAPFYSVPLCWSGEIEGFRRGLRLMGGRMIIIMGVLYRDVILAFFFPLLFSLRRNSVSRCQIRSAPTCSTR